MSRITREQIHEEIDRQMDDWKWGQIVPIDRGRISVEIQIENGEHTITIAERQISKKTKPR